VRPHQPMTLSDVIVAVEHVAVVEPGTLTGETTLESLQLDSLQMFELVIAIEIATGRAVDDLCFPSGVGAPTLLDLLHGVEIGATSAPSTDHRV
jgi:acyl carrier protein